MGPGAELGQCFYIYIQFKKNLDVVGRGLNPLIPSPVWVRQWIQ